MEKGSAMCSSHLADGVCGDCGGGSGPAIADVSWNGRFNPDGPGAAGGRHGRTRAGLLHGGRARGPVGDSRR